MILGSRLEEAKKRGIPPLNKHRGGSEVPHLRAQNIGDIGSVH